MGIPFRDLIYDVCGGVPGGSKLKGVIPGGSSMPPLDASELDVPIEFDALMTDARIKDVEVKPGVPFDMGGGRKLKTMAGSGGVVVFDDSTDVVALCARIMEFYAHESCGQCTPCREGTGWLARVCKRLAHGRGAARRRRPAGQHRQRHRRQHHLPARRRGGLADAGLPDQVPRRLRGQAPRPTAGAARRRTRAMRERRLGQRRPSGGEQFAFWLLAALRHRLRAVHHHPHEPGHRGHVAGGDVLRAGRRSTRRCRRTSWRSSRCWSTPAPSWCSSSSSS